MMQDPAVFTAIAFCDLTFKQTSDDVYDYDDVLYNKFSH